MDGDEVFGEAPHGLLVVDSHRDRRRHGVATRQQDHGYASGQIGHVVVFENAIKQDQSVHGAGEIEQ